MHYNEITEDNVASFHFHGDPATFPITSVIAVPNDAKASTVLQGRYLKKKLFNTLIWPFITVLFVTLVAFWLLFFGVEIFIDSDYLGVSLVVIYIYFLSTRILLDPKTYIAIKRNGPGLFNCGFCKYGFNLIAIWE